MKVQHVRDGDAEQHHGHDSREWPQRQGRIKKRAEALLRDFAEDQGRQREMIDQPIDERTSAEVHMTATLQHLAQSHHGKYRNTNDQDIQHT